MLCRLRSSTQTYRHEQLVYIYLLICVTYLRDYFIVQSLGGPRVQTNVREVSLHFHELDHLA